MFFIDFQRLCIFVSEEHEDKSYYSIEQIPLEVPDAKSYALNTALKNSHCLLRGVLKPSPSGEGFSSTRNKGRKIREWTTDMGRILNSRFTCTSYGLQNTEKRSWLEKLEIE